jgi:threonine/homoserine efflux transporter RhtA
VKTALRIAVAVAIILMIPLVAMQLTDDVNRSPFDFAAAAALLFGTGMIYAVASSRTQNSRRKAAIGLGVAAVLFIGWVQFAAGII